MATLSDAVVIGIVLTLVFSAAIYYMFTLFQQLEGKVSVFNNIIFDLKKANEASMMMFDNQMNFMPEPFSSSSSSSNIFSSENEVSEPTIEIIKKEYIKTPIEIFHEEETIDEEIPLKSETTSFHVVEANYESMTYKELQAEGKRKHIKGTSKMTKAEIIDSLKKHDSGSSDLEGIMINNPFENFPPVDEITGEFIAKFDDEEITL